MVVMSEAQADAVLAEHEREKQQQAEAMMAYYDGNRLRRYACWAMSTIWLSIGGQTLIPIGLIAALLMLLPDIPAWSLVRRLKLTRHRAWLLVAFALIGLFLVCPRIGVITPDGGILGLSIGLLTG